MVKNCLFGHMGSQNGFWLYPPPLICRWSIDCNSLVFLENQSKNHIFGGVRGVKWKLKSRHPRRRI